MEHDCYSHIASHYDRTELDWFARRFGAKLITELTRRGFAGRRVLDAGCGTGSLALVLAEAGFSVTGVDLSDPMLQQARRKDAAGRIAWHQADLTTLALDTRFDVITCVADVLSHIESDTKWNTALQRLADHLVPGGLIFLDVMTLAGLERMDGYSTQERENRFHTLNIVFEPAVRRSTLKLNSFVRVSGTEYWERATETIPAWGRTGPEVLDALRRAGLESFERVWLPEDDVEHAPQLMLFATKAG